ncbi:MAG: FtsX-like permease family protein [Lentisphaeraceae bacterium]|nr:FtsX-like permease family protein [Lentisphaeraceae bacterium]
MFSYTLMNLIKSPMRSFQLVISTFLVFMLILAAASFQEGMQKSLSISGDSKNVILLGSGSEESLERSEVSNKTILAAQTIQGLQKVFGRSVVSPEIHFNTLLQIDGVENEAMIRGVQQVAISAYPSVEVSSGRFPNSGEIMVGRLAWKRLGLEEDSLKIGQQISYEDQLFTISGIFAAPGTVMESEIWMNLNDLTAITQRDSISSITVRLDSAEFDDIDLFAKQRLDLQLTAIRETDYYKQVSSFYEPIQVMAWITAILISAGALFGGLNTFYAAIESRSKELATLQSIGYSRLKLFLSLYGESLLIHTFSLLLAISIAALTFPLLHVSFGTTFFSLAISQWQVIMTTVLATIMALVVTLLPGWHCLHPPLNSMLKD